jgi:hypothetical protein
VVVRFGTRSWGGCSLLRLEVEARPVSGGRGRGRRSPTASSASRTAAPTPAAARTAPVGVRRRPASRLPAEPPEAAAASSRAEVDAVGDVEAGPPRPGGAPAGSV